VVVADIDDQNGQKMVRQLDGGDKRAIYVRGNVGNISDIDNLFRETLAHFNKVDILINNVGIRYRKPMLEISDQEWDEVIGTNLTGTFRCTQRAVRVMAQQRTGCIVNNITSQAGVFYSRGQGCHYAASKAAIIQLTRVLSFELGPLGIRVNSIAPGSLSLDPVPQGDSPGPGSIPTESTTMPRPLENVPLRRLGTAEDVAQAVLFFVSDQSRFITGQTLLVNGGVIV
jgi:3-oxoacyl-[acyl-carrier protein] reductase